MRIVMRILWIITAISVLAAVRLIGVTIRIAENTGELVLDFGMAIGGGVLIYVFTNPVDRVWRNRHP